MDTSGGVDRQPGSSTRCTRSTAWAGSSTARRIPREGSASFLLEHMGMHCAECYRPVVPFGASLDAEGRLEFWGEPWRMSHGRPLCLPCASPGVSLFRSPPLGVDGTLRATRAPAWTSFPTWDLPGQQEQEAGPAEEDEDADGPPRPKCTARDVWECWREQEHPYMDPSARGGSGGGGGKRFGGKKVSHRRQAPLVPWS